MVLALKEMGRRLVENAIILSCVAAIIIAILWLLGSGISSSY